MRQYNYIKAPAALAERIGLAGMRKPAGEGFIILSESDMRMVDLTPEEKVAFFGCEVLSEQQAATMINKNETVNNNPVTGANDASSKKTLEE